MRTYTGMFFSSLCNGTTVKYSIIMVLSGERQDIVVKSKLVLILDIE